MAQLSQRKAASIARLMLIKGVSKEQAAAIRKIWHSVASREEAREAIDSILQTAGATYGVEYLGWNRKAGEHVYYCNSGDSYRTTVLFQGLTLYVGNWAYLVETGAIKDNQQF